ncbi:MAG TPA: hypothetical protein VF276_14830 [Chloroflexia bacterium]
MDDSVRAEYQRRLNAGDRGGALAYLRMLRTQTDDPSARDAYTRAIDSIENGGDGSDMAAASVSTADSAPLYGGSAGPFGDNPDEWAATHQPRHDTGVAAGASGTTAQAPAEAPAQPPVWAGPSTPPAAAPAPAPAPAPEHHGPSDPISEAIGGLQRGIHDRLTGQHHEEPAQAQAPAPAPAPAPEHHGPSDPISEAIGCLQRGIHDRIFGHDDKAPHTAQAQTESATFGPSADEQAGTRGKIADEDAGTRGKIADEDRSGGGDIV